MTRLATPFVALSTLLMLLFALPGCGKKGPGPEATPGMGEPPADTAQPEKAATPPGPAKKTITRTLSERKVTDLAEWNWVQKSFRISPDCRHVAFAAGGEGEAFVVLDGEKGKTYKNLGSLFVFSSDGRLAYTAFDGSKWFVVLDKAEGPPFDGLGNCLVFSPDGSRLAYDAQTEEGWAVVEASKAGKSYEGIGAGTVSFSPDGRRLAHVALEGDESFVVVDGEEGKRYRRIAEGTPVFSPDSGKFLYGAYGMESFIVPGGGLEIEERPAWFIVVDKEKESLTPMDGLAVGCFFFCPDGSKWACNARIGEARGLFIGNQRRSYSKVLAIGPEMFSKDGAEIVFAVAEDDGLHVKIENADMMPILPHSSKDFGPFDDLATFPGFGPDGRTSFLASARGKWFAVVDGVSGMDFDAVGGVLSRTGERVGYVGVLKNSSHAVIDGDKGKAWKAIGDEGVLFSPGGARSAYRAMKDDRWCVVVDGQEGEWFDQVIAASGVDIVFDSDDRMRYLALRGMTLVVVEERLSE